MQSPTDFRGPWHPQVTSAIAVQDVAPKARLVSCFLTSKTSKWSILKKLVGCTLFICLFKHEDVFFGSFVLIYNGIR